MSNPARTQSRPRVSALTSAELEGVPEWREAFQCQRKDHRYYGIVEKTILPQFDYRYFVVRDGAGAVLAIQPFFMLDQDLLAGVGGNLKLVRVMRRLWPRFLTMRTLMAGCAAGEGHLDTREGAALGLDVLATQIKIEARRLGARLIVLKEFPAVYRIHLASFVDAGFTRVPSMPMTRLNIDYASFADYMEKALSGNTRKNLKRKFRHGTNETPLQMEIATGVSDIVDEIYPLYIQVYERSNLRFEKLTKAFFSQLAAGMPEKARFFVWRLDGRAVAFALCMVDATTIWAEYLGLDYPLALERHLYHLVTRDIVTYAMSHGLKELRSSGLNYDPKLHMRHVLVPLDLYVRHTSAAVNLVLRLALPYLSPVRSDPVLRKFSNYSDLWDASGGGDCDAAGQHAKADTFASAVL